MFAASAFLAPTTVLGDVFGPVLLLIDDPSDHLLEGFLAVVRAH